MQWIQIQILLYTTRTTLCESLMKFKNIVSIVDYMEYLVVAILTIVCVGDKVIQIIHRFINGLAIHYPFALQQLQL